MGAASSEAPSGGPTTSKMKEVVSGRRMRRPTHPIFVIFPLAFLIGALALDVLSRLSLSGATLSATWAIVGGLAGAILAIITGLVDRSTMRPTSRIYKIATRHMWIQLTATAVFVVDLAIRWTGRHQAKADILWIVLDVLGAAIIIVGGDAGAQMVFRFGFRVGGEDDRAPASGPAA